MPLAVLGGLVVPAVAMHAWWSPGPSFPVALAVLVAGQFLLLFFLLRWYFVHRVAGRLSQLAGEIDFMADGRFDAATQVRGGDEVGRLASAVDHMRRTVGGQLAERQALFEAAPIGLLLVRNRVIERANRRAEVAFAATAGGLQGRPAESIYPSHGDFIDVGARAYGTIERGEVFAEELTLARQDGTRFRAILSGCALDAGRPQDGSVWAVQPSSEERLG